MRRALAALALVATLAGCTGPWLLIPRTGLRQQVVHGDQSAIDAGRVVDVSGWCPSGSRHLAGHRSTNGSVFRSLPSLRVGDEVVIYEDRTAKVFRLDAVTHDYRCDGVWGDLVLQTSHPDGGAYFFHLSRVR